MRSEKGKLGPSDFDLRVRERNLAKGLLDEKIVERHLTELPDVEPNAEPIGVPQPALGDLDEPDSDGSFGAV